MNRIRYLAAGLLCLTGIIHVARLGMAQLDAAFVTTAVIFGVVYLIIGIFLFRNNKTAYYFGAIVPLIGLCGGPLILTNPPHSACGISGRNRGRSCAQLLLPH